MPTEIERSYLEQGYRLPEGLSWDMVDDRRRRWGIDPVLVPVAVAPGCVGWGVPFIDGRPLNHSRSCGSGAAGAAGGVARSDR